MYTHFYEIKMKSHSEDLSGFDRLGLTKEVKLDLSEVFT